MIKTELLKKFKQAAEELSKELKTGIFKTYKPERAFAEWYIQARFGNTKTARVFDGKKDGGIDALVEAGNTIYVLQSKYEVTAKVSLVLRSDISAFQNLARKFKEPSCEGEFFSWLTTVDATYRPMYEKTHNTALQSPKNVRFIFITTKRNEFGKDDYYETEDIQKISSLWYLYSEGFTPPTETVMLTLKNAWHTENGRYKTYVGLADVRSFIQLMKEDENERLFAQNVRTNLHSKINEHIRKTYEEEPEVFWLCNNGIYIVCKKVTAEGDDHYLTYPSVINGSQTLHSISESTKKHSCKVLVRILEMDILGDPKLLSDVVRRTNSQNTMNVINLFAHDTPQINIATYLDRYKIFYERREKEWKNERRTLLSSYIPVKSKELAQWLSTSDTTIGLGTARSAVAELFNDSNYRSIFGAFGRDFQTHAYEDLVLLLWSGLFIGHLISYLPADLKNFAQAPKRNRKLLRQL